MAKSTFGVVFLLSILQFIWGRKHHLNLKDEVRSLIDITDFGFMKGGSLEVNVSSLGVPKDAKTVKTLGFTLDMSGSAESASYAEGESNDKCVLEKRNIRPNDSVSTVYLTFDLKNEHLEVKKWGQRLKDLRIVHKPEGAIDVCAVQTPKGVGAEGQNGAGADGKGGSSDQRGNSSGDGVEKQGETAISGGNDAPVDENVLIHTRRRRQADAQKLKPDPADTGDQDSKPEMDNGDEVQAKPQEKTTTPKVAKPESVFIPLQKRTDNKNDDIDVYNTTFVVCISDEKEEGLYSLFFHHCQQGKKSAINLSVHIIEMNVGPNYLSAGDIPLPVLYTAMSILFFCSAIYWVYYLCQQTTVFKIHYLMFFLCLLKSLSLMFHAVDYHFIALDGSPMQAFAILFYITYLTKGALLFGTIVLIGSGWAFIKPILSDSDKKLFWIVIPLQILANVAYIITTTSEEGDAQYDMWKAMFVTVDIICCGAILYPVVWSIRHLQEAARTDGKAAISLVKLKLFRTYYTMVVCYIYFSRIVVYLLKVTMPFQFMWLDEFFFELATYVFYVVTAYKFRPGSDNPYLQLPSDDEDDDDSIEMDEVISETGVSEGLKRLSMNNTTRAVQREANHSA